MAIQYKWVLGDNSLSTAPSENGLTDVVKTIHWRYAGTDGDIYADTYGAMACATPSETDFTAYPDLTEDQVISWLEAGLDVEALQANVAAKIADIKNPPIVNLPLPWAE
jgi:hypothetical protein